MSNTNKFFYDDREKISQIGDFFSTKNHFTTVILCLLLGLWGAHSFYVGRYKSGTFRLVLGLLCILLAILHIKLGFLFFLLALVIFLIDLRKIMNEEYNDADGKIIISTSNFLYILKFISILYICIIIIGIAPFYFLDPKSETSYNKNYTKRYDNSMNEHRQSEEEKNQQEKLSYDGYIYKTIQIGNQVWMAENLKTKKGLWYCYGKNPENCEKYGMLYDWNTANKICPENWHLPTSEEWNELFIYVGGKEKAGRVLKTKDGWIKSNNDISNGINSVDFSVLPAGAMDDKKQFVNGGYSAFFWSSTGTSYEMVEIIGFNYEYISVSIGQSAKYFAFSVRCIKNKNENIENKEIKEPTIKEKKLTKNPEIKKYKTVKIGKQTWMSENLNWKSKNSKCYRNQDANCKKYGRLYSWEDAQIACPEGWHLPSYKEWDSLINYVGGKDAAGKILKSEKGWNKNSNGENLFGFSVLPAGSYTSFEYRFMGLSARFWSSSEANATEVVTPHLNSYDNSVNFLIGEKTDYYSIRCIEN